MAVQLAADTVIADRFRLNRLIGRGGMGSVWHATHLGLDIPCAVKFIEGEFAHHPEAQSRFEREAKAAAQLRSPHVVQILDHGVFQATPYIAMELLDGEDLGKRLTRAGRLSPIEVATIVTQVCRALTKAHAAGIVHRDLKPDNIFLVRDDDREIAKVLDFGIAKANTTSIDGSNTKTGAMLGTPYYMSPEQAQGIRAVDHRADLWSLAVIVYQCVTGRLPFESEALGDLLVKIIVNPIPVPSQVMPDISPSFDKWWERAASRDPALRFQTAKELGESLSMVLGLSGLTDVMDRGQVRAAMSSSVGGASGYPTPPNFGSTPGFTGQRTPVSTMPIGASTPHPHGSPSASASASRPGLLASSSSSSATTGAPMARTYSGASPSLPPKKRAAVAIAAAVAIVAVAGIGAAAIFVAKGKGDAAVAPASAAGMVTEAPATPAAHPAVPTASAVDTAPAVAATPTPTPTPSAEVATVAAVASAPPPAPSVASRPSSHGSGAHGGGHAAAKTPAPTAATPPAKPAKPASDLGF